MVRDPPSLVIDASLALNAVISTLPYHLQAVSLFDSWSVERARLVAPPLFESETDSVIRRLTVRGLLSGDAGVAAQALLDVIPIEIVYNPDTRRRARQIAESFNHERVYDATYCALAEIQGCQLWTADSKLYRSVNHALAYVRFAGSKAALG